jgi:hypothetical protein
MNSNKILIVISILLMILVIISGIMSVKKSSNKYVINNDNDEFFIVNIQYISEVIRSYEKVKHLYGKKNALIYRYVNNTCNSCLNTNLEELLVLQGEIGKEKIWIFPAYPSDRQSRIQLSNELFRFNFQNIPIDSLFVPIYDAMGKSYFAVINNKRDINMVFFPDENNIRQTRRYLMEVKRKLMATE